MPKKIDEADVKKECPSCGLGVSLESKVCEFCGWDFDEEDEWILQIEKLERDLMMEKQKFEPGTVDDKIESTLHSPNAVMKETPRTAPSSVPTPPPKEAIPTGKRGRATETKKPAPAPEPVVQKPAPARPTPVTPAPSKPPESVVQKPAPSKAAPPEPVVVKRPEPVAQRPEPPVQSAPETVITKVSKPTLTEAAAPSVRRVRVVKSAPVQETQEAPASKRRLVRKVKGRS